MPGKAPDLVLSYSNITRPPSVNHQYVVHSRGVSLSVEARRWREAIAARIKADLAARVVNTPHPPCFVSIRFRLRTCRMDLDGPIKTLIDGAIKDGLFIEDRWVGHLAAAKELVKHEVDEGIDLDIRVWQLKTREEFTMMSREVA